jgi:serine protease
MQIVDKRSMWALVLLTVTLSTAQSQEPNVGREYAGTAGGARLLEEGQPMAMVHATVEDAQRVREAASPPERARSGTNGGNLSYHGGTAGVGVETAPKIYLVLWGSQWTGNDPSGEEAILDNFYGNVGGSNWSNTVTQYCENVPSGTVFCNGAGTPAGNQTGVLAGVWYDNASAAPGHPRQSQFATEAVRAAGHFGNTTASKNASVHYVIATATGNNSKGFGTSWCAYHSSTSSSYGNVAYTNLPYMTDAGANCGANFNGLGATAGITIVGGHEMAETMTDQFPSTGWTDSGGSEIGDKCAWISSSQGASADVMLTNGTSVPVQSLWSDAFNGGAGGCVLTYP